MTSAALRQAISSSAGPCGEDLSFSAEFEAIEEARRFDDPSLSTGVWEKDIKEADWPQVVRLCETVLSQRSKDLRVVGWLIEAQGKLHGLAGLAEGYELAGALCTDFWSDLHPQPDGDDMDERLGALNWWLQQTPRLLRNTLLTDSSKGRYTLADQESAWLTAKQIENNPGQADEIAASAHVRVEDYEAARSATPAAFFAAGLRDADRLLEAMQNLEQILDTHLGEQAPSFSASLDVLKSIRGIHRRYAGVDQASTASAEGAAASPTALTSIAGAAAMPALTPPPPTANPAFNGPIQSREQALRQLEEIAAFFRRTEPHSPVAYLAEKAARWGSMSLHEWLRSVVKDDTALLRVEELLGVETHMQEY